MLSKILRRGILFHTNRTDQKISTMSGSNKYDLFGSKRADSRALAAEFVATALFVFIGCGVAVSGQTLNDRNSADGAANDNGLLVAIALAFGFAISVLAYTIAPVSGGHINPAVTFAFVVLGDFNLFQFGAYLAAQCAGAVLGAAIVWGTYESTVLSDPPFGLGINTVHPSYSQGSAFLGEMMGTILLVWTVLMTAVSSKSIAGNLAPIAIGWSVMLAHLLLVPLTGCGINPARSFGPHVVAAMGGLGDEVGTDGWWVYYIAPFVGAAVAAVTCQHIFDVMKPEADAAETDAVQGKAGASVASSERETKA
ncbi:aquaporin-1 [Fistulifera solaris]|uniref:Aquaporin-1 n=1 Tax=Fistulifera solaris TaxID=1519565 RepID=A0A1Z5JQL3_FISSO|nr:aquaporin-1 [Fistulifera solaris]|eukprot:GAX16303.1 aquaporin-1 [Fistulifera solaris]